MNNPHYSASYSLRDHHCEKVQKCVSGLRREKQSIISVHCVFGFDVYYHGVPAIHPLVLPLVNLVINIHVFYTFSTSS